MAIYRTGVVCAGQGAQAELDFTALRPGSGTSAGMPADPAAQALWLAASTAVGGDFAHWWAGLDGPARRANRAAQLAVTTWQTLQWLRLRRNWGQPAWVAGYSAGELAAHAIAGSLAFADLPGLVVARAAAMDQATQNAAHAAAAGKGGPCLVLLAERLPPGVRAERREALERHGLQLAILRSPAESVWAAPAGQVAALLQDPVLAGRPASAWGMRVLDVQVPSHSAYLREAVPAFAGALDAVPLQAPVCGVLAGVDAEPVRTVEAVRASLLRQLVAPIAWHDVLQALAERGVTAVLDLGPGADQTHLIEVAAPGLAVTRP